MGSLILGLILPIIVLILLGFIILALGVGYVLFLILIVGSCTISGYSTMSGVNVNCRNINPALKIEMFLQRRNCLKTVVSYLGF